MVIAGNGKIETAKKAEPKAKKPVKKADSK